MAALVLPEYYADLAQTTLSSSYTAASGSIVVTTAANLSTTRQFHFMITDQTTGAVKCIGKATALTSSTFTVTMTTDANANSGDFVTITLCQAAMDQIISDCDQFGTFASLPASVPPAGRRYKCTDAIYEFISTGSVWQAFAYGYPVTLPPSASWTAENLSGTGGTSNYTNGNGYLVFTGNGGLGTNYRSAPGSTPYSFIAKFRQDPSGMLSRIKLAGLNSISVATVSGWAIGFRDSGGKYLSFCFDSFVGGGAAVYIAHHTSSTDTGTSVVNLNDVKLMLYWGNNAWVKIQNDGTNLKLYGSLDRQTWYQLYTETITNFLANANNVFWGAFENGTIILDDWTQGV